MTKECTVSVICTAYNHEKFIRDALEGFVKQQTTFEYEVLINDDASPDNTANIIREYEEKYPQLFRVFYQRENQYSQGVNVENDILIAAARGKYIALCEGDDYWTDPQKLQVQVDYLEANPDCAACVGNTVVHYCDGSIPDALHSKGRGDHDVAFSTILSGMGNSYHPSTLVFRSEYVKDLPEYFNIGFNYGFDDLPRALYLAQCGRVHYIDRPLSLYRIGSNPTSWSSNVESYRKLLRFLKGQIAVLRCLLKYTDREHSAQVEDAILEHEFELLYIEGRDREQRKDPYRKILRRQGLSYRTKNLVKCLLPGIQRAHRKKMGFE